MALTLSVGFVVDDAMLQDFKAFVRTESPRLKSADEAFERTRRFLDSPLQSSTGIACRHAVWRP
jgi:multidrug efflux pump subunit AcrB